MESPDELVNMLLAMGTTDRDALVQQFMQVVSCPSPELSRFFLEANNWNLQDAIASFYDSGTTTMVEQQHDPPQMELVADMTVESKDYMAPGALFHQTWRIKNSGMYAPWPANTHVVWVQGDKMPGSSAVEVSSLHPGQQIDISLPLVSPTQPGSYAAGYRLCAVRDVPMYFGETMWVIVNVGASRANVDAVEQERLQHEAQHQLDDLIGSFSHMKPETAPQGMDH